MKKYRNTAILLIFLIVLISVDVGMTKNASASNTLSDTSYTFAYNNKVKRSFYEGFLDRKHKIVFLGSRITENGDWNELFQNKKVVNRGIGGDVCRVRNLNVFFDDRNNQFC